MGSIESNIDFMTAPSNCTSEKEFPDLFSKTATIFVSS